MRDDPVSVKKLAVVTKRERVARFFSLEAEACGIVADVMTSVPEDISGYGMIIIDRAIEKNGKNEKKSADRLCGSVSVTKLEGENKLDTLWELPVSVKTVRAAFEGSGYPETLCRMAEATSQYLYVVDKEERILLCGDRRITLTEGEWRVLFCLNDADGRVVERDRLSALFGATGSNLADVYVCNLRRKLSAFTGARIISTVRGKGYALLTKIKTDQTV